MPYEPAEQLQVRVTLSTIAGKLSTSRSTGSPGSSRSSRSKFRRSLSLADRQMT